MLNDNKKFLIHRGRFKIVGETENREGGLTPIQLEDGSFAYLRFKSNHKDYFYGKKGGNGLTNENIKDFFNKKAELMIKPTDIEDKINELKKMKIFKSEINKMLKEEEDKNDGERLDRDFEDELIDSFLHQKAKELIYSSKLLGVGSIIEAAISSNVEKIKIKDKEKMLDVYESYSILFENKEGPSKIPFQSGLYYVSNDDKTVPISLRNQYNKGYSVFISPMASSNQVINIIEHSIKTIEAFNEGIGTISKIYPLDIFIKKGKKKNNDNKELFDILKEINKEDKSNKSDISLLKKLQELFTDKPNLIRTVNIRIPLAPIQITMDPNTGHQDGDSPFMKSATNMAKITFNKVDIPLKEKISIIEDEIQKYINNNGEFSSVYRLRDKVTYGWFAEIVNPKGLIIPTNGMLSIIRNLEKRFENK